MNIDLRQFINGQKGVASEDLFDKTIRNRGGTCGKPQARRPPKNRDTRLVLLKISCSIKGLV
jgi:hypothetical protein